jgi:hypothetical protein
MELTGELLGFQFVRQLAEFVQVDARFEAEGVRLDAKSDSPPIRLDVKAGAKRLIDGVFEGQFPRGHPSLELSGDVGLQSERCPHKGIITRFEIDVQTSTMFSTGGLVSGLS